MNAHILKQTNGEDGGRGMQGVVAGHRSSLESSREGWYGAPKGTLVKEPCEPKHNDQRCCFQLKANVQDWRLAKSDCVLRARAATRLTGGTLSLSRLNSGHTSPVGRLRAQGETLAWLV